MKPEHRGQKFGEQLLKQVLWYAQKNRYDLVYLTAFPKQEALINLLLDYGFEVSQSKNDGELFLEKEMRNGALHLPPGQDVLTFDRIVYPRFWDGPEVQKFCVPIQGAYHQKLFPEIGFEQELPLFAGTQSRRRLLGVNVTDRTPGNTIRKVYLCRAQSRQPRPGDVIFFYMSKTPVLAGSQCITSVGVVRKCRKPHRWKSSCV